MTGISRKDQIIRRKILVVEPNPDFCNLIESFLTEKFSVDITFVAKSQEAIENLQLDQYSVVIQHYGPKYNDAIAVLAFLEKYQPKIPLIIFGVDNPRLPIQYSNFVDKTNPKKLVEKFFELWREIDEQKFN